MSRTNNVDVAALEQVAEEARGDPAGLHRVQRLEGEWLLEESGPRFRAEVSYEGGTVTLEAYQPGG